MRMEAISRACDHEEECPACGGAVHRRPYGEMYAGSYVLDGERVEIRRVPDAGHVDPIFLDALTQYFDGKLSRLYPSDSYYSCGGKYLHRRVWESAFGPIPLGCHIHHKDGNPARNAIDNLECIDPREHGAISGKARKTQYKFTAEAKEKARQWHFSEAGKLWHKRQNERVKEWAEWSRVDRQCDYCGDTFRALKRTGAKQQRFCSSVCRIADYQARVKAGRAGGYVLRPRS